MSNGILGSKMRKILITPAICCADEWFEAEESRYDIERLGFVRTTLPEDADLLVIQGAMNERILAWTQDAYSRMPEGKKVLASGTCACGGGLFPEMKGNIPVDVFIVGCPPRPEALIDGLLKTFPEGSGS